jgi:CheY-like chemotaxis protein
VPKTLLAVDDSATMRKVFEITFGGEDFRVLTADGGERALSQMSEEPVAVVIDTSLGSEDPYALAKEVRARDAKVAIVLMGSRYTPYDATRGKSVGVDDSIDKPFDTQSLIDKVKKAVMAHEAGAGGAVAAHTPAPAPVVQQAPAHTPAPAAAAANPFSTSPRPPSAAPAVGRAAFTTQRTHTLSFEGGPTAPPGPPPAVVPGVPPGQSVISRTSPSGMPVFQTAGAQAPAAQPPAGPSPPSAVPTAVPQPANFPRTAPSVSPVHRPPPAPAAAGGAPVAAAVNGHLAGKLGDLGLSPAQVEAVLALSREVVERVVWEVVPQLAETIIKEEISRLTKE